MTPADFQTARAALDLTQGALASALGVSRRTVQHWEGGERAVPETIRRIMLLAGKEPALLKKMVALTD